MKFVLLSAFILLFFFACRYDHAHEIPPPATCDSLQPSYQYCIQPVLKANCYSCHSDTAFQHGNTPLDIENYDSLKSYLNLQYRGDGIYGSKFMAIIGDSLYVIPMPPTGHLLQSDIRMIDRWIGNGAPKN